MVWWALRTLRVDEWPVTVLKAMYANTSTIVKLKGMVSKGFGGEGWSAYSARAVLHRNGEINNFSGRSTNGVTVCGCLVLIADSEELLIRK